MQSIENRQRTLADNPQYFGGYLNMARHNVFTISNHLAIFFGKSPQSEENKLSQCFLCTEDKNLSANYIMERAIRFLPIIKTFDAEKLPKEERIKTDKEGKNMEDMRSMLKKVFEELNSFRNDYSHYYSTQKGECRKVAVSRELADFLRLNFRRAVAYTKLRMQDVLTEDDYKLAERVELIEPDGTTITTHGLVFLTCLFLEREHAFQLIGKVQGLKGTQYKEFIATREVFMAFCVRLPHDKFVSEDSKSALILDISNELNRCPDLLYDVMTETDKHQFRPELNQKAQTQLFENSLNEKKEEDDYDQYLELLTKRVRHSNRFRYFALRFMDEMDTLGKYRFQIDLGKFTLARYEKQLQGESVPRVVVENAKAFGKLDALMDEDTVRRKIDQNLYTSGFSQFAPHYNINNNKIGISTKEQIRPLTPDSKTKVGFKLRKELPQAFLSIHELPKIILLDYLQKGRPAELIKKFIQLNDRQLLTMEFIREVKEKLPKFQGNFQKETDSKKKRAYYKKGVGELLSRKAKLNQVLASYGLNDKQIPSRILDYWLQLQCVDSSISFSDRIKLMKRDCMDRLKVMEKHAQVPTVRTPKVGEMATYLAKDMVDMIVDPEKKQRITSFFYDKMQECLALYANPEKKALLIHIVSQELRLYEPGGHPFLEEINLRNYSKTSELYTAYLQEKGKKMIPHDNPRTQEDASWMRKTFYVEKMNEKLGKKMTQVIYPKGVTQIPFTIQQWNTSERPLEAWLNNVNGLGKGGKAKPQKKPIDLPTNLFDEEICTLLQQELNSQNVEYPQNAQANELLKLWWRDIRCDTPQPFYSSEREYRIYDEPIRFTLQPGGHFRDYYQEACGNAYQKKNAARKKEDPSTRKLPEIPIEQIERVFKNSIAETEKNIRIVQEEDCMMLLMLEQLMERKDLELKNAEGLLNETTQIEQKVEGPLYSESRERSSIQRTIIAERKRKHHSVLRKYQHDRRLPQLFEYTPEGENIALEWLELQLTSYNQVKLLVLDRVFQLEKRIIESDREGILQRHNEKNSTTSNIQHEPYLDWMKDQKLIDDDQSRFMKSVRNTFSHNQFPHRTTMERLIPSWDDNTPLAQQIFSRYDSLVGDIFRQMTEMM